MTLASRRSDAGTALIETVVVAFAILAVVVPVLTMVGRLSTAHVGVVAQAADVADWAARHGTVPPIDGPYEVVVDERGPRVFVTVTTRVDLIGIGGGAVSVEVSGTAEAPISPFRSMR